MSRSPLPGVVERAQGGVISKVQLDGGISHIEPRPTPSGQAKNAEMRRQRGDMVIYN
ncbi:MAG: hypothetical protein ACYSR9_12405 [Planctomycetota bacterium]